jgi:calcium-dependent protein kinase
VIAFYVLTGRPPLKGETDQETFNNIVKGNISYHDAVWEKLTDDCHKFVKLLLSWEEHLRPTAEEALQHPWIINHTRRKSGLEDLRLSTMTALSNLEAFDAQSKLRVATCTFIATQLMDKEEREKIDDVFRAIDLNNDGTLNRDEVKQGYETYFDRALSDEEIDAIFQVSSSVSACITNAWPYLTIDFLLRSTLTLMAQES